MRNSSYELSKEGLCVFSIYSKDGIIYSYVEYLIKELLSVTCRLVIVVNGELNDNEVDKLYKYANEVIIRKNEGFDAGAYAEVLQNYLGRSQVQKYDFLVLCNDTFFGPFIPFKDLFIRMKKENYDLWGINILKRNLLSHIQSFFLVFGSSVFCEDEFWQFWERINPNETDIRNVFGNFECALYETFRKKYRLGTYCDTEGLDVYQSGVACIVKYGLPVLKKKAFDSRYNSLEEQRKTIAFLKKTYPTYLSYVVEYLSNKAANDLRFLLSENEVDDSCKAVYISTKGISLSELMRWASLGPFYLYGSGIIARELLIVYSLDQYEFSGFIVSQKKNEECVLGFPVYELDELAPNSRFIVAMNAKNSKELKHQIGIKHNALFLWE